MKLIVHSCIVLILCCFSVINGNAVGHVVPQHSQLLLKTNGNIAELYDSGGSWLQAMLLFARHDQTVSKDKGLTTKFESFMAPGAKATTRCPNEFVTLGEHCYYFSLNTANWHNAEQLCHRLGSVLALPISAVENALLVNYLRNHYKGSGVWYVGGTDEDKEGQWVWAHGKSPMVFTDWIGHPNNAGNNEHCIEYLENYDWKWNDIDCNKTSRYICQI